MIQGRFSTTGFDDGKGHVASTREQHLGAESGLQTTSKDLNSANNLSDFVNDLDENKA